MTTSSGSVGNNTTIGSSAAKTALASSVTSSKESASSVFKAANNSIFQMAALMQTVRGLSQQASGLRTSDAHGLAAMRESVATALGQFNKIATDAGVDTSSEDAKGAGAAGGTKAKDLTVGELQATLANMQGNLKDNIGKVGTSIFKAILAGSSVTDSQTTLHSAQKAITNDPLSAFKAQLAGLRTNASYRSSI